MAITIIEHNLTRAGRIIHIIIPMIIILVCPEGTYKSTADPGDIRSCSKCPHEHQTSPLGSNSADMCTCREGYLWQNGR